MKGVCPLKSLLYPGNFLLTPGKLLMCQGKFLLSPEKLLTCPVEFLLNYMFQQKGTPLYRSLKIFGNIFPTYLFSSLLCSISTLEISEENYSAIFQGGLFCYLPYWHLSRKLFEDIANRIGCPLLITLYLSKPCVVLFI